MLVIEELEDEMERDLYDFAPPQLHPQEWLALMRDKLERIA